MCIYIKIYIYNVSNEYGGNMWMWITIMLAGIESAGEGGQVVKSVMNGTSLLILFFGALDK